MPTTRKRHTITETPAVVQALSPLRAEGVPVDFSELVVRGAHAKLAELRLQREDAQRRRELRERFLERTRTGRGIDVDAAAAVRDRGWIGARDE